MKLEHANIEVKSIREASTFLMAAFPEFRERGRGDVFNRPDLGQWVHVGSDDTYLALQQPPEGEARQFSYHGVNHLGFEVDSVAEIIQRLAAAGYSPTDDAELDSHPFRRRVYFEDNNGFNWEFVEYLSLAPEERNQY